MNISPKVKPIYATLLRLGFGKYLISSSYNHFVLEKNWDSMWKDCVRYVSEGSNVIVLTTDYSADEEEAFGYFLDQLLIKKGPVDFSKFIKEMADDFFAWKKVTPDYTKITEALLHIGIEKGNLDIIFFHLDTIKQLQPADNDKVLEFTTNKIKIDEKLCFVLMPFQTKFDSIYKNIIKKVVENDAKFTCIRADEIFGTKPIIEDIWEHIKKAKFLIADLTDRNPNVFYELGIAHALNKNVILLTQDINDVPFDLRHYRCLVYEDSIAGADKLKEGLLKTINVATR